MPKFKRTLALISTLCLLSAMVGCTSDKEESTTTTTSTQSTTQSSYSEQSDDRTSETTNATKETAATVSTARDHTATSDEKTTVITTAYAYSYAGFNPVVTDMAVPFNEILLNRYYRLPDGYTPNLAEAVKGSGVMLDERVAPHYQKMYDAALDDGITLKPISGYRSFDRQKRNFENRIALFESQGYSKAEAAVKTSEVILLPGTSEHNAGLAMDICSLEVNFEKTKEFRWLQAHAHEYGFIMRYPKDKTHITKITYEPWHYRFVGIEIATHLKKTGHVLEEYLET